MINVQEKWAKYDLAQTLDSGLSFSPRFPRCWATPNLKAERYRSRTINLIGTLPLNFVRSNYYLYKLNEKKQVTRSLCLSSSAMIKNLILVWVISKLMRY